MATDPVGQPSPGMAPSSGPSGPGPSSGPPPRRGGRGRGHYPPRRKVCQFCVEKIDNIDYKDVTRLRRYISDRGKIEPRRKTGTCAKHQRRLSRALKRARQVALLPIAATHVAAFGGWFQPPPFFSPTAAPHAPVPPVAPPPVPPAGLAPVPTAAPSPAPASTPAPVTDAESPSNLETAPPEIPTTES